MPARHILVPLHDFYAGGIELIAFRLARAWLDAGQRVTFLVGARDGPLQARLPEGVELHILSPERPQSPTSRLYLGKEMAPVAAQIAPDVIFLGSNFLFNIAAPLKKALPNVPLVAKASNPIWQDGPIPVPTFLVRTVVRKITKGIDHIVAMAPALREEVSRYVAPVPVSVIHDPFLDDDKRIAARTGRPAKTGETLRLLVVGRLEAQKDPLLAVDVLDALRRQGVDAEITMIGGGPMEQTLRDKIARCGLTERFHVAGYVSNPGDYYAAADMLLMTSRYEGVPAAIGEALSSGLPFIATPCTNWLKQLAAEHADCGTVVSGRTADALASAIVERAARPYASAAQTEAAIGMHRMSHGARAYLELFESLL